MRKFCTILVFVVVAGGSCLNAQDFKMGYTSPANTANPAFKHVVLEIEGVDKTVPASPVSKGMLVPRMTLSERNGIATAPSGLLVFVTDNPNTGFYFNANSTQGTPTWEKILTGQSNSVNGTYNLSDSVLKFNTNATTVSINTSQNNELRIGKAGTTFIRIPQSMGSSAGNTGLAISDNSDLSVTNSALVKFNSTNKGILLPTVSNLSNISLPVFGLLVIVTGGSDPGLYIQLSNDPNNPEWAQVATKAP